MATNPVGPGTKNVAVNMPQEMADRLKKWADREGINVSILVRGIIRHAMENKWEVKVVVKSKGEGANSD